MSVRIAIVDDHKVVTRSLQVWLQSFDDFEVVGIANTAEALLASLETWRPDIVIQDLLLPAGLDGLEATRRILAASPGTKVLALTASLDAPRMMGALKAGAHGYLRKDAEPETLVVAVRTLADGGTFIDPSVARLPPDRGSLEALTDREVTVLRLVAAGRSNRAIATALAISEETVKTHVSRVLAKLGVENRAQAAAEALRRRLVSIEDCSVRTSDQPP